MVGGLFFPKKNFSKGHMEPCYNHLTICWTFKTTMCGGEIFFHCEKSHTRVFFSHMFQSTMTLLGVFSIGFDGAAWKCLFKIYYVFLWFLFEDCSEMLPSPEEIGL